MTPTTPREALAQIRLISGVLLEHEINAILTALREGGHLRTPGTVEVCKVCGLDVAQLSSDFKEKCRGNVKSDNYTTNCPLKQVTNEKA